MPISNLDVRLKTELNPRVILTSLNTFYFLDKYLINHLVIQWLHIWSGLQYVWILPDFLYVSKKIIKMHRGNTTFVLSYHKKINTEHERKKSISQAIIPYSLVFLVFCSRVESFLAGISAGREGRRQTNETMLTTDIFTPPGDHISSKTCQPQKSSGIHITI